MGKRRIAASKEVKEKLKATTDRIALGELLSETKPEEQDFSFWIVGDTPLICHAWSEKAKLEMLKKQTGATTIAKEKRNPAQDFIDSLYDMGDGVYGFPVTAIKKAIWSVAHKDRGIARTEVQAGLWLDAEIVRVRPALSSAICDMPLVRIISGPPEMREDMVRIGTGLRKTANLAYRAQFTYWAIKVTGKVEPSLILPHALAFLVRRSGTGVGIGDWRNEKGGYFGAYHLDRPGEAEAWENFRLGKGPLPMPDSMSKAAE